MPLTARISAHFEQSAKLKLELAELLAVPIAKAAQIAAEALLNEKKYCAAVMAALRHALNTLLHYY